MAKIDVKDLTGAVTGSIELSDEIFGIEPNEVAMSTVVRNQLANRRQGTQKTKTRSEVSGGIFGPTPRSYSYTVPKKVKRLALKSALSSKVASEKLIVIENMDLAEVKTATVAKALKAIGAGDSSLIVLEGVNRNAELSARNIKDVKTALVNTINVMDILKYDSFVATKAAVEKIEEVYK